MEVNIESMTKKRIAISVSDDLLRWADLKVKDTTFASRSHAFEHALTKLKEADEKKKQ